MSAGPLSDAKIVDSGRRNADAWTAAVRERRIESRELVTDRAIVDAVPSLIARAQVAGGLKFTADVAVCNFSLLGRESAEAIFAAVPSLLEARGAFVIQTVHPIVACGERSYEEGWREGSWAGFSSDFTDPAPWYFRTLEGWLGLPRKHRLQLLELREPLDPRTRQPASVIFIAGVTDCAKAAEQPP